MLPAKTKMLQRATVFNKNTIQNNFKKMCVDKSFYLKLPEKRENLFFRNYNDYLISLVDEEIPDFKYMSMQKAFSSKYILEVWKNDYNSTPLEKRVKKIVVFDTETTDIDGYIVSYAMVEYDMEKKEITKEIHEFINPEAKINAEAYSVHKISEEDVKDKPTFKEKMGEFLSILLGADMIVGHNVLFDFGVLKRELERAKYETNHFDIPIFDTMYFSADIVELEKKKMPRLEECVNYFFGHQQAGYHDALEDVKMTLKVFEKLIDR
jgi:DNA polymerase III epsilon subunit-like protein